MHVLPNKWIYMDVFLSRHQCGFRQNHRTQHCLLAIPEKWRSAVNNKKIFGALLTDLSKAFDCLLNELFLAKFHAYGFSIPPLKLVYSYLKNRKQRLIFLSQCVNELIYSLFNCLCYFSLSVKLFFNVFWNLQVV